MGTVAGIPTTYRGIKFRSRLEATWAAFFTGLCWEYEYEPFDGHGYIPDFAVFGPATFFVEVKPETSYDGLMSHSEKVSTGLPSATVVIVGCTWKIWDDAWTFGDHASGPLFQDGFGWARGMWSECAVCRRQKLVHDTGIFTGYPCGHYEGGHIGRPDYDLMNREWARAKNLVQWHARDSR